MPDPTVPTPPPIPEHLENAFRDPLADSRAALLDRIRNVADPDRTILAPDVDETRLETVAEALAAALAHPTVFGAAGALISELEARGLHLHLDTTPIVTFQTVAEALAAGNVYTAPIGTDPADVDAWTPVGLLTGDPAPTPDDPAPTPEPAVTESAIWHRIQVFPEILDEIRAGDRSHVTIETGWRSPEIEPGSTVHLEAITRQTLTKTGDGLLAAVNVVDEIHDVEDRDVIALAIGLGAILLDGNAP